MTEERKQHFPAIIDAESFLCWMMRQKLNYGTRQTVMSFHLAAKPSILGKPKSKHRLGWKMGFKSALPIPGVPCVSLRGFMW